MIERICAVCRTGSPLDALSCVECGAFLDQPLAERPRSALVRRLPAIPVRWQRAGKVAALGAVALAVEAGAAWLQHREAARPAPLARREPLDQTPRRRVGFVARQRIWETYQGDKLSHRVVEQTLWQIEEQ